MLTTNKARRYPVTAVIVLAAACILGIIGVLSAQLYLMHNRALDFAAQSATHLGAVSAQYMEDTIDAADLVLRDLVNHSREAGRDGAAKLLEDHAEAEDLMVIDAKGKVATAGFPPGISPQGFLLRHAQSPDPAPSAVIRIADGKPYLVLSRRLENAHGAFYGVAIAAIRLDRFEKVLKGGEVVTQAALYLPTGERLLPTDPSDFPPRQIDPSNLGTPMRRLAGTDLYIGSFVNEHEALRWWRHDASVIVPLVALFVLLLGGGTALMVVMINNSYRHQMDRIGAMQGANSELERLVDERTQALLEARRDAERASSAKSRFLAGAAHDLRQPLQALMMFIDELGYSTLAPADQALVRKVESSAQSLSHLLNGLLDIGAIDSGMIEPRLATFPLARVLDAIEARFRAPAEAKGLALTIVPTRALVHTDEVLLNRILSNLVSNAIRDTERGRILVGCRRRGAEVEIQVADTGIGIADEQLALVFEEYFQVGNQCRDRRRGTGLGLAIVERLAALLHHRVRVSSRLGAGSVFSLRLPRAAGQRCAEGRPCEAASVDGRGALVVVVDDDPEVRSSIERSLKNRRYAVLPAASGREAMDLLRWAGRPAAAIIADYRLAAGETGTSVIEAIRATAPEAQPVAILLTGEQQFDRPLPADVTVMRKPIAPATLCAAIERLRRAVV